MQYPGTPTYYPGTPTRFKLETQDNTNIQQPPMPQHLALETQQQLNSPRPGHDTDYFSDYFQHTINLDTESQPDFGRPTSIHTLSNRNSNSSLEEDLKELLRKHNATDQDLASVLLDQGSGDLKSSQGPMAGQRLEAMRSEVQFLPGSTKSTTPQDQIPQLRPLVKRPGTPPNRIPNGKHDIHFDPHTGANRTLGKYLLTPETTPASGGRYREGECAPVSIYDTPCKDENATIKAPPNMHRGISHDLFTKPDPFVDTLSKNSPPPSAPLVAPATFGDLTPVDLIELTNIKLETASQGQQSYQSSPTADYLSYATDSFQSSPEMDFMRYDGPRQQPQDIALFADLTNFATTESQRSSVSGPTLMARTDSMSTSSPEASFNPPVVDTGIEAAQIRAYIQDPEEPGGRWTCTYPECGKKFGRKENIKSHVQTHLGDRQWLCRHCQKCFVRLHDLKRHEKIHSGYKPHACKCGHTFARQDALTRHRQRGVCIGAIEGAIRKEIKRGRPRKKRPDHEERFEKAEMARQRVLEKKREASVSGPSVSSSSVCSFPSPPAMNDLEGGFSMSRDTSTSYYGTPPELDLDSGMSAFDPDGNTQAMQFSDNDFFDAPEQANLPSLDAPGADGLRDAFGLDNSNESSKTVDILKLLGSHNEWSAESFDSWSG